MWISAPLVKFVLFYFWGHFWGFVCANPGRKKTEVLWILFTSSSQFSDGSLAFRCWLCGDESENYSVDVHFSLTFFIYVGGFVVWGVLCHIACFLIKTHKMCLRIFLFFWASTREGENRIHFKYISFNHVISSPQFVGWLLLCKYYWLN